MFDMTEENLNAMIREVIIPQIKPQSTRNSYFRKQEERRRYMYWGNKNYMHIWGIGHFGIVYNGLTGRIKKSIDYRARKDVRNKRLIKKIQRRQPRKCKVEIANGAAYKKIKMRIPIIG